MDSGGKYAISAGLMTPFHKRKLRTLAIAENAWPGGINAPDNGKGAPDNFRVECNLPL